MHFSKFGPVVKVKTHHERTEGYMRVLVRFENPEMRDAVRLSFKQHRVEAEGQATAAQEAALVSPVATRSPARSSLPPPLRLDDRTGVLTTEPPSPHADDTLLILKSEPAPSPKQHNNYTTPPLFQKSSPGTGRLIRSLSEDRRDEAGQAMCALAEMSQMCV